MLNLKKTIFSFLKKKIFFNKKKNDELLTIIGQLNGERPDLPANFPEIVTIESKIIKNLIEIVNTKNSAIENYKKIIAHKKEEISSLILSNTKDFAEIAHDFRTPFNSAVSFIELLKTDYNKGLSEEQSSMIDILHGSISSLNEKFSYMLEFHKAGNNIDISLDKMLNLSKSFYFSKLESKNLKLEFNLIENKHLSISNLDLMVIIDNLLDNAIKFADPQTTIKILLQCNSDLCRISISNIGKVYTGSKEIGTQGENGTGTGLLRIKALLEKNNSQLKIQSEGKKTMISFDLPLA